MNIAGVTWRGRLGRWIMKGPPLSLLTFNAGPVSCTITKKITIKATLTRDYTVLSNTITVAISVIKFN
jgi:hypothetical protein